MIKWFVIDLYILRNSFLAKVIGSLPANRHAPGIDPAPRLAARAVTEIGKQLIETSWRWHSIIDRGVGRGGKNEAHYG